MIPREGVESDTVPVAVGTGQTTVVIPREGVERRPDIRERVIITSVIPREGVESECGRPFEAAAIKT